MPSRLTAGLRAGPGLALRAHRPPRGPTRVDHEVPILTIRTMTSTTPSPIDGVHHRGQIDLSRDLFRRTSIPIDVPSLSARRRTASAGATTTTTPPRQPAVRRLRARSDVRALAAVIGEEALRHRPALPGPQQRFEGRSCSRDTTRSAYIEETLDLGWQVLGLLPRSELTRIRPDLDARYHGQAEGWRCSASGPRRRATFGGAEPATPSRAMAPRPQARRAGGRDLHHRRRRGRAARGGRQFAAATAISSRRAR